MLSRRPRENFKKKQVNLRVFKGLSIVFRFSTLFFLEKCQFFKNSIGLYFSVIDINFKSIIIHSEFE